jgi:uncharacterized membrane protein
MDARSSITVNEAPAAVYARWRDLAQRPPEWEVEIVEEVPGEELTLRSLADASVPHIRRVRVAAAPGGRGTEVHVTLHHDTPAGPLGAAVAKLFGDDPGQQLTDELRRFKQRVETGEVARSDGNVLGTSEGMLHQRPARPLDDDEVVDLTDRARAARSRLAAEQGVEA